MPQWILKLPSAATKNPAAVKYIKKILNLKKKKEKHKSLFLSSLRPQNLYCFLPP